MAVGDIDKTTNICREMFIKDVSPTSETERKQEVRDCRVGEGVKFHD